MRKMDLRIPEAEAIKVWCPKKRELVPHWECLGSFVQGVQTCPELIGARVDFTRNLVEMDCWPKRKEHEEKRRARG